MNTKKINKLEKLLAYVVNNKNLVSKNQMAESNIENLTN